MFPGFRTKPLPHTLEEGFFSRHWMCLENEIQADKQCMKRCWDKRYPWPHNKPQSGWYHERCEQDCNKEHTDCEEEKEKEEAKRQEKLKFSRMDEAIDWIKSHKTHVVLGTIVIVAGVAFVLATSGSGALILTPLLLSSG